ncbi:MAG: lipoyl(octanoyl) transferase LipB [Limnochordales bacterium]
MMARSLGDVDERVAAQGERPPCWAVDLGRVPYAQAWDLQAALVEARLGGRVPDLLLFVEHPHVYTLGRGADERHVLWNQQQLAQKGVEVYHVDRGGDVTYHGPGQVVGYPILDLRRRGRDAHKYLRDLEEAIIRALADFGIAAGRVPGLTGVWVGGAKIAAIGVKFTRWVTSHGFALNVNTDLTYFSGIIPCGLSNRGVTSLAQLLGREVPLATVHEALRRRFAEVFDLDVQAAPRSLLQPWLERAGALVS